MTVNHLGLPLTLPCGATIANRFAKAALSEQLGDSDHAPQASMQQLYSRWARGGAGLVLTGNVMVDHDHLGEPKNVVVTDERHLPQLTEWASAAKGAANETGSQLWMQINHPGRQTPRFVDPQPVAPSAIAVRLGGIFATPRELTSREVSDIVDAFATTAAVAKAAGFAGVQIHGAHGYLISQFLSPRSNKRTDEWGGDAAGRMRFVLEIVRRTRERVGPDFPIGAKLNSADFQRGGTTPETSMAVAQALAKASVDLLEISGGTYEKTAMMGTTKRPAIAAPQRRSTLEREAYFLEYAQGVRQHIGDMPLMLTGGFRSAEAMEEAVASGACDMVGLGRPLTVEPDLPNLILAGTSSSSTLTPKTTGIRKIDGLAEVRWHEHQMHRLAAGKEPAPNRRVARVMAASLLADGLNAIRGVRG